MIFCCSVTINTKPYCSSDLLCLWHIKLSPFWTFENNKPCLSFVVSLSQLAVGWARSYATQKRSRERSQCSPHRCSYRHPNRKETIFLPRRFCCSTWRLLCQPAKFKYLFMESEYNPQQNYKEFQTLINMRASLLICGCTISTHRSWDLNKICFKSGVPIIENVMIERVSMFLLCNNIIFLLLFA